MKKNYIKPKFDLYEFKSRENLLDGSEYFNLNDDVMGDGDDLSKQRDDYDFDDEW